MPFGFPSEKAFSFAGIPKGFHKLCSVSEMGFLAAPRITIDRT